MRCRLRLRLARFQLIAQFLSAFVYPRRGEGIDDGHRLVGGHGLVDLDGHRLHLRVDDGCCCCCSHLLSQNGRTARVYRPTISHLLLVIIRNVRRAARPNVKRTRRRPDGPPACLGLVGPFRFCRQFLDDFSCRVCGIRAGVGTSARCRRHRCRCGEPRSVR